MWRAAVALLLAAPQAEATTIEITRVCFGDFCVESREAFMAVASDPARQHYRIRFSRTQSVLYIQAGPALLFPHCAPHCDVVEANAERRSFQPQTGRLVGRLLGSVPSCGAGPPRPIHLYVYNPEASPDWLTVAPNCTDRPN